MLSVSNYMKPWIRISRSVRIGSWTLIFTLLPTFSVVPSRRSKPRQLQFTPISKHGNTFQLEAKTKAKPPIYAGLN